MKKTLNDLTANERIAIAQPNVPAIKPLNASLQCFSELCRDHDYDAEAYSRLHDEFAEMGGVFHNAVRQAMVEDSEDFAAFEGSVAEPLINYDEMVKRLRKDGRI